MIVDKLCFNSQINSETTEGSIHKATPVTTTKKIHSDFSATIQKPIHSISSATNFGLIQTIHSVTRIFEIHKYFKHQYLVRIVADYRNKYYLTHKPEVATILLLIHTLASATTAY